MNIIYDRKSLNIFSNKSSIYPIYLGIFLDKLSIFKILQKYIPKHDNIYVDHCTILHKRPLTVNDIYNYLEKFELDLGDKIKMYEHKYYEDELGQTISLQKRNILKNVETPHITLSINSKSGKNPVYSNELMKTAKGIKKENSLKISGHIGVMVGLEMYLYELLPHQVNRFRITKPISKLIDRLVAKYDAKIKNDVEKRELAYILHNFTIIKKTKKKKILNINQTRTGIKNNNDCIIFDIDGTVANIDLRLRLSSILREKYRINKWKFLSDSIFMNKCDIIIQDSHNFIMNIKSKKPNIKFIYLSGRLNFNNNYDKYTKMWLIKNNFPVDAVYINNVSNSQKTEEFKTQVISKLNKKYNIICSIGDDYRKSDSISAKQNNIKFIKVIANKWRENLETYNDMVKLLL